MKSHTPKRPGHGFPDPGYRIADRCRVPLLLTTLLWNAWLNAAITKAIVVETGDTTKTVLFDYERRQIENHGDLRRFTSEFRRSDKSIFLSEDITVRGSQFQNYAFNFPVLKESADIRVADGKVVMKYKRGGKEDVTTEDWTPEYVVAPTLIDRARENWNDLQAGKSVRVRMIVPDRAESFGFKFVKDSEVVIEGKKYDLILFKPTSFLISLIVAPIKIYFQSDTRQVLKISGRTILKKKVGDNWEDFQADTIFVR